ncbi:hypothetical protein [Nocardiopsis composta]|uniref:Uncharacterized protein n=1 Tax=Nocardiopsis composta TaxID=157465 RepID=A0A7W8VFN7_9ACTN|nr:hypothetical protein [Nocardiopsis composta]MBB5434607.1 hypothetical protein [Nocardiopsis composta]
MTTALRRPLPSSLTTVRVLLFAFAALSLIGGAGTLLSWGFYSTAVLAATFMFILLPGAAAFLLALFLPRGGPLMFWLLIILCVFWILAAIGNAADGPKWLIQLCWPLLVLFFTMRKASRVHLLHR